MSHHGYRHSRIGRIINAKHRHEAGDGDVVDDSNPIVQDVAEAQKPLVSEVTILAEPCYPLLDKACLENRATLSEDFLVKRQAESSQTLAEVPTVVQVVESASQTSWPSTGMDFPMTNSTTALLSVTISVSDSLLVSSPTDSPITSITSPATQITTTATATATATSKQRVPISSPKVSAAASSQPHTSTPLVSSASSPTTSSTTSTPTVNSVYYHPSSYSSFYSDSDTTTSWTGYYSSSMQSPSSSTGLYGGAVQTGLNSGSGVDDGSGSSTNTGSSGSGSSISPTTSKIVGGVVGSVAGLALLFALLFYILRRRGYLQRFLKDQGTETLPSSDAGTAATREMSERPSSVLTTSYLAPAFMKRWRQSTMTTKTDSTIDSNSSERGFQKIAGRKIPPVLTHGGDGFGGGLDGDSPTVPDYLIGLSPPSPGAGPSGGNLSSPGGGPPPASPFGSPLDTNYTREADEFPPPERPKIQLPVSSSVNFGSPTMVTSSPHLIPQPQSAVPVQRDSVGRSHPSLDGSRGSRFTESLDL
ncbi:uncharacterized protein N7484_006373 [Penicillium longicatenatum]|uniref:uncharacterized protein n=1 Tax=Penicillium longicatenatum TaxID=1561947 RepID=UPI002546F281|nr:uncharacterized protein N7484_006373 [Penicillium longicatenatum]KAJ5643866.1 hypothetical protein N7484_006373 [Penicillium longicatenatum]